jgi:predicted GNAT superfamily acetyltransferase
MPEEKSKAIIIRELRGIEELAQVEALEKDIWVLADRDVLPLAMVVATQAAGSIWIGAFEGSRLVGFAFGFPALEQGRLAIHSHMLGVRDSHRDSNLGFRLKLAQRERALALRLSGRRGDGLRIEEMTWTFDPLQSRNAHLNFSKLGVVSDAYKVDFYGPQTSSALHRNGTDRLWVRWPMSSRRVQRRSEGSPERAEVLDALSTLAPLIRFDAHGMPVESDLEQALSRQRVAIEIPSDIVQVEKQDLELARQWRRATRWAFTSALNAGFFVAEFCRAVRGQQGPGAYLLEKGTPELYVPEMDSGW